MAGSGAKPNQAQAERWSGAAGRLWVDEEAGFERQLGGYGAAMLDAAALTPTDSVLDVGCGTGTTALDAGRQAASVLGIDLSPVMLERARARAAAAGATNVRFVVADAQVETFAAPFDVVVSRFGLMFFDDPAAAFANLRCAVGGRGRLAAVWWQSLARNPWMRVPGEALRRVVPGGDLAEPGEPGPFSLGSADQADALLRGAGWTDITLDSVEIPVAIGGARTLGEAVGKVGGSSLGQSVLAGVEPAVEARALDAVRAALAPHVTPDGVVLDGAAWVVRATASSHR